MFRQTGKYQWRPQRRKHGNFALNPFTCRGGGKVRGGGEKGGEEKKEEGKHGEKKEETINRGRIGMKKRKDERG